ncbi:MAG TPA: hypothetical protein PLM81_02160 [Ginsengibacter sp.]|nr:hypothetical protein [Ginsengibacter sp.]HRP16745.1 hypothetical protein [Ginsengibacter sp.]HRP44963.1 hypothetical protein [Ginsengibacter sp.]
MKLFFAVLFTIIVGLASAQTSGSLEGAWMHKSGDISTVLLFQDGYFVSATYSTTKFIESNGGPFTINGDGFVVRQEFNSAVKELKVQTNSFTIKGDQLLIATNPISTFERIDNGKAPLAGVWRISGRMQEGKITEIHTTGTRKTLKMLTGTRFQWFAIDPATNLFSGSGGGTYSFENGKYTEHIEFFSRDATRVGASLSFNDHLDNGKWHHTGLSSRGDKIYEIWEKVK